MTWERQVAVRHRVVTWLLQRVFGLKSAVVIGNPVTGQPTALVAFATMQDLVNLLGKLSTSPIFINQVAPEGPSVVLRATKSQKELVH